MGHVEIVSSGSFLHFWSGLPACGNLTLLQAIVMDTAPAPRDKYFALSLSSNAKQKPGVTVRLIVQII